MTGPMTGRVRRRPGSCARPGTTRNGSRNEEEQQTVRGTVCPTNERDLARKEKALAEAAALIILRKKAEAIWGRTGEDE
jgi:hypothetical protein